MDMGQTMSLVRWICQAGALGKRVGGFFERAGMYKFFTVLKRVKGPLLVESVSVSLPCTDWADMPECMKEAR
jgi:hypothetical protein